MKLKLIVGAQLAHIVLENNGHVIFTEDTERSKAEKLIKYGQIQKADSTYDAISYSKPYQIYEIGLATVDAKPVIENPPKASKVKTGALGKKAAKKSAKKGK